MSLTGATLIRNGNLLKYPWKLCIDSLSAVCDQVFINYDPLSEDDTANDLYTKMSNNSKIKLFPSIWCMENTGDGKELAYQANTMLPHIKTDWVLYLQADELIHEYDSILIQEYLESLSKHVSQVELYRTYFWGDLKTRAPKFELWLGRIFRTGTHEIGGDGMFLVRKQGKVARLDVDIYHYSRIGKEKDITKRIRTLDSLFHQKNIVNTFEDFTYNELSRNELVQYTGSHPYGIKEFYNV